MMKKAKLVFLDRDGVINRYPGDFKYVTRVSEFVLLPGVKPALEKLTGSGYKLFVVSNQAGVSKGLYTRDDLDAMDERMQQELGAKVVLSGIYYCTHAKEETCLCRKPKTALLEKAVKKIEGQGINADIAGSYFIGDSLIDVETGKAAGVKTIMVFSGREKPENKTNWSITPDFIAPDLVGAVDLILAR